MRMCKYSHRESALAASDLGWGYKINGENALTIPKLLRQLVNIKHQILKSKRIWCLDFILYSRSDRI